MYVKAYEGSRQKMESIIGYAKENAAGLAEVENKRLSFFTCRRDHVSFSASLQSAFAITSPHKQLGTHREFVDTYLLMQKIGTNIPLLP